MVVTKLGKHFRICNNIVTLASTEMITKSLIVYKFVNNFAYRECFAPVFFVLLL